MEKCSQYSFPSWNKWTDEPYYFNHLKEQIHQQEETQNCSLVLDLVKVPLERELSLEGLERLVELSHAFWLHSDMIFSRTYQISIKSSPMHQTLGNYKFPPDGVSSTMDTWIPEIRDPTNSMVHQVSRN